MTKSFLKFRPRILIVSSTIILIWTGLCVRFFFIQVVKGGVLEDASIKQVTDKVTLPPIRGTIRDRNLQPLAENIISYSFGIHPNKVQDSRAIIQNLTDVTGRSSDYYKVKFASHRSFEFLERNLKKTESGSLLNLKDKGLLISKHGYRYYPQKQLASQILGFTNIDNSGLAGIELEFDEHLKGDAGWIVLQTDGKGRTFKNPEFPSKSPRDGDEIILSIDINYQSILRDELLKQMNTTESKAAMGIITEPYSGKILAMCSLPDFDPNELYNYPPESYKNKVITDQFEPGSTFKIITATAALALKSVSMEEKIYCENGSYKFQRRVIKDWREFDQLTFPEIMKNSSNVGIIKISEKVGSSHLYNFARNYGFGSITGISLAGESSGSLKPVSKWSNISLAEIAIGHEVSVTALQLAYAYGAIANGGYLMKPLLVEKIFTPTGDTVYQSTPQIVRKVASTETINLLKEMLKQAVESGTGTNARIKGWNVAGKTGTAQKYFDGSYSNKYFISSFAGFLPSENPELLAVIVLDEPKLGYHWGSMGAAPVFKEIMTRIINSDDQILVHSTRPLRENSDSHALPPQPIAADIRGKTSHASYPQKKIEEAAEPIPLSQNWQTLMTAVAIKNADTNSSNLVKIPNVAGMSLRGSLSLLQQLGLKTQFSGSGVVSAQFPEAGTLVEKNTLCTLILK